MKKSIFVLLASILMIPAFAQEEKPENVATPSKDIENIRLANSLAKYGYENFSAMALLEAADILSNVSTQELKPVSFEQGEKNENQEEKVEKPEFNVETLLADAKKFAEGNDNLLALVDAAIEKAKTTTRGRVGGPGRTVTKVYAYSTDTYLLRFVAGELAEIALSGDGDTDLDLYVYDSNGNLIVKDDDYYDDCYVRWVPAWTGNYIVKIVNRGAVYNRYAMVTN